MFIYKPGRDAAAERQEVKEFRQTRVLNPAKALRRHRFSFYRSRGIYWCFFALFAVYNLIGDDLRHLLLPCAYDVYAYIFNVFCILFFALDILFALVTDTAYRRSMLLWLDVIATAAMVLDLGVLASSFFNYRNKTTYGKLARVARVALLGQCLSALYLSFWQKQGRLPVRLRAAFAGLLAGRRVPKKRRGSLQTASALFPQVRTQHQTQQLKRELLSFNPPDGAPPLPAALPAAGERAAAQPAPETTDAMIRLTSNRLIIVVFLVVCSIPLFRYSTFWTTPTAFQSVGVAGATLVQANYDVDVLQPSVEALMREVKSSVLYMAVRQDRLYHRLGNYGYLTNAAINAIYREYELIYVEQRVGSLNTFFVAIFENKEEADANAMLNILRVAAVALIVLVFSALHSLQVFTALAPLREMVDMVARMADDPLLAAERGAGTARPPRRQKGAARLEPEVISQVLLDTSRLLALGLGRAASRFAAAHLRSTARPPPPIIVEAIFGFVVVWNFSSLSDQLSRGLCAYLNELFFVVHEAVDRFGGEVNKNIGEAVLLVFKARPGADAATLCLCEVLLRISAMDATPAPQVTAGLHAGWAVEGAIGTYQKLDFSYLSPTVNLAARIASATRQFGAQLLLSQTVASELSGEVRGLARRVDRVLLKGSSTPVELFSVDLDLSAAPRRPPTAAAAEKFIRERSGCAAVPPAQLASVQGLQAARRPYTPRFLELWEIGMNYYFAGDFPAARKKFALAREELGGDGPADTLLAFIDGLSAAEAKKWKGVRKLTAK